MKFSVESLQFNIDDEEGGVNAEAASWIWWIIAIFVTIIAVEFTALYILLALTRDKEKPASAKTLIVLGSGGHTAEMLKLVESLDKTRYTPRAYAVAATDKMSGKKAAGLEATIAEAKAATLKRQTHTYIEADASGLDAKPWELIEIPRSREVGQWYITSIWTTLKAQLHALAIVWHVAPQVVLVNGPGTCIPVCFAALVFRLFATKPCKIIYVESIARTRKLSLSGKILYYTRIADLMLVQWKELADKFPGTKFAGRLY